MRCIGRVLVGVEGSLGYRVVLSLGVFGMSVEFVVSFVSKGVFFTGAVLFDLNFR